ncbi:hypothetical protein LTR66_016040 [Elasticomyces elasticus]|nr:hypothetical protein LTR66_016040 [Elasticomyces elasticus]
MATPPVPGSSAATRAVTTTPGGDVPISGPYRGYHAMEYKSWICIKCPGRTFAQYSTSSSFQSDTNRRAAQHHVERSHSDVDDWETIVQEGTKRTAYRREPMHKFTNRLKKEGLEMPTDPNLPPGTELNVADAGHEPGEKHEGEEVEVVEVKKTKAQGTSVTEMRTVKASAKTPISKPPAIFTRNTFVDSGDYQMSTKREPRAMTTTPGGSTPITGLYRGYYDRHVRIYQCTKCDYQITRFRKTQDTTCWKNTMENHVQVNHPEVSGWSDAVVDGPPNIIVCREPIDMYQNRLRREGLTLPSNPDLEPGSDQAITKKRKRADGDDNRAGKETWNSTDMTMAAEHDDNDKDHDMTMDQPLRPILPRGTPFQLPLASRPPFMPMILPVGRNTPPLAPHRARAQASGFGKLVLHNHSSQSSTEARPLASLPTTSIFQLEQPPAQQIVPALPRLLTPEHLDAIRSLQRPQLIQLPPIGQTLPSSRHQLAPIRTQPLRFAPLPQPLPPLQRSLSLVPPSAKPAPRGDWSAFDDEAIRGEHGVRLQIAAEKAREAKGFDVRELDLEDETSRKARHTIEYQKMKIAALERELWRVGNEERSSRVLLGRT